MGLMPDQFWSLTVREFWLKWNAFDRAEDRARALALESALMIRGGTQKENDDRRRDINILRRYPLKKWLLLE
jgi:hypothetical protein